MIKENQMISLNSTNINYDNNIYQMQYLFCKHCNVLIGFVKCDKNNNFNSENINEYYFLKKNIKLRQNKLLNINLISFKESLLNNIKEELSLLLNKCGLNFKINLNLFKKDGVNEKFYKKSQFDITFIIHKMEGRIFLLGKNGYFNNLEKILKLKQNSNIYFILISNEINENINNNTIKELIIEGGEKELEKYYKNKRIIFLDNLNIKNDFVIKKDWFWNNIVQIYSMNYIGSGHMELNEEYYEKRDEERYTNDKNEIINMYRFLNNKTNYFNDCFS